MKTINFNRKKVYVNSIQINGIDLHDYPDFCDAYIESAEYEDDTQLTVEEIDDFTQENYGIINELIHDNTLYL